jgi:hypothetical protein
VSALDLQDGISGGKAGVEGVKIRIVLVVPQFEIDHNYAEGVR